MGILRLALGEGTTNMKLFVFACLLPWHWPTPSPRLMPTPTTATTAWATTVLDTDSITTEPVLDTTATTARGLLMLSPLPLLRPILLRILRTWIPWLRIRSWPLRIWSWIPWLLRWLLRQEVR